MKKHPVKKPEPIRVTVKQTFESPVSSTQAPAEKSMPPTSPPGASKTKKAWRWFWWFIWEDTSIWSWFANIILAFVIIKFLVYPALGFALGTSHPIVAVVSGSMEHDLNFDQWWVTPANGCKDPLGSYSVYGITKDEFKAFDFANGFNKGDLMILTRPKNIEIGNVVVFTTASLSDPVIHRVILLANTTVTTRGDHNCGSAPFETDISQDRLIGKASLRVPLLGWIKIGFVNLLNVVTGRA